MIGRSEKTLPPRKRRLTRNARRALRLASSQHGVNEALLVLVHGFKPQMFATLVRAGLVAAEREIMMTGATPVEVVRLQITAAGRKTRNATRQRHAGTR